MLSRVALVVLTICVYLLLVEPQRQRTSRPVGRRPTPAPNRLLYGDINRLRPTGKRNGGVYASNLTVSQHLPALQRKRHCYNSVANSNKLQASLIAAIASRESSGGITINRTNGYGDRGRAYGIIQCDLRTSGLNCTKYRWDSCEHMQMMVSQLVVPYIQSVRRKFPRWTIDRTLQGGVAAFNFGVSNVRSWEGLDDGSTGNDYSNDVIARAQWLHKRGWN
ncbi:glycine, glutamate and proline-rich protein-like [Physella acuta]|uniref:glycine, glutamate and proline-rich protein-like n=1 Tax=Physella acuta TaxID=109671 RepID=UPI0027DB1DEA|nr:glycine, glutamate and proline-rich protein-like [Physella acuta]